MRKANKGGYGLLFGLFLLITLTFILTSNELSDAIDQSLGIIDTAVTVPVVGGGASLSRLGLY